MGALPTKVRLQGIMEAANPSIHIWCFKASPTSVQVDSRDRESYGVLLPGTEYFKLEMSNPRAAERDLRFLRETLVTSLRQGDNAYVHCMSGLCRAALGGALLTALLMQEDIDTSISRVEDLRNVQMTKARRHMGGPWMERILREEYTVYPASTHFLVSTIQPGQNVVHACMDGPEEDGVRQEADDYPLCEWEQGRRTTTRMAKCASPAEARHFSSRFCYECWWGLPSSGRLKVRQIFSAGECYSAALGR